MKLILSLLFACISIWCAEEERTTHDDPVRGEGGSLHLFFQSRTIVDPYKLGATTVASLQEIIQHTHENKTVLLFQKDTLTGTPVEEFPVEALGDGQPEIHIFLSVKQTNGTYVNVPDLTNGRGHVVISRTIDPRAGMSIGGHAGLVRNLAGCRPGVPCRCLDGLKSLITRETAARLPKDPRAFRGRLREFIRQQGLKVCPREKIGEIAEHLSDAFTVWKTRIEDFSSFGFVPVPNDNDLKNKLNQQPKFGSDNKPSSDHLRLQVVSKAQGAPEIRMRRIELRKVASPQARDLNPNLIGQAARPRFQICSSEEVAVNLSKKPAVKPCQLPPLT